jgi:3-methyladenine DNA glycosylase AlkD
MAELDATTEADAIVADLEAHGTPYLGGDQNDSYTGSGRPFFCVSAPNMRRVARTWLAAHRGTDAAELLAVVDRLFRINVYEARVTAAVMLGYSARARLEATPAQADRWLDGLNGWAEIDSLCASVFGAEQMASDWPAWKALIEALSCDANISKRRAALVLLVTPTRTSDDPRFADLAFEMVERLKAERAILITKAVSWLLRSMTGRFAARVDAYVDAEAETLPAIAVRETRAKLTSGTKSGRPAKPRPSQKP